jgi:hypothetical protein
MITMICHAMEEGGFLLADPLCEACERPVAQDGVLRCHRRKHGPAWQPTPIETRVRLVCLCADCRDDPRWEHWPRISVEKETVLELMGQIGLCAFTEAEAR